ncbi:hypothetical protein CK203_096384 [Vitis vinifera]|uniref:Serine/threonine-protein phosphatase 7 long form-like n=1 Tax=Vitis vinifera TaxID=29760 RepID=A0A438FIH9_VITVI|nr:hypothetical protein CK203_096384 [Vitis vinifera]
MALSHDGGRRYDIMTTNMEQGANRLASNEEYTPYVDAKIKANVVKADLMRLFYMITSKDDSIHILAACHFRSVDFRPLVQHYYSTQSYYNTWAPLFHPIFNVYEWPPYDGPIIMPSESMKRASSGRPKSSHLHNEMDVREGKTSITCGLCKQSGHNRAFVKTVIEFIRPCDDRHRSHLVDSGQDVAVILGLRIHGLPITGTCDIDWSLLCYELLGVTPLHLRLKDSDIDTMAMSPVLSSTIDSDDATLERWGSVVLAHLYREFVERVWMVPPILLDVSHYYRDSSGSTDFGDHQPLSTQHLDHDAANDLPVLWEPYMGDLVAIFSDISSRPEIWQTMSPLICFDIVEWHRPSECCDNLASNKGYLHLVP